MSLREIAGMPHVQNTPDGPIATIKTVSGLQAKPCFLCRHCDMDNQKLIQFLRTNGLKPNERGNFITPIVQDFDDRKSLEIDPKEYGFCRDGHCPTHLFECTCEYFDLTQHAGDLRRKFAGRIAGI